MDQRLTCANKMGTNSPDRKKEQRCKFDCVSVQRRDKMESEYYM